MINKIYKFEADWCGMCKALDINLTDVLKDYPDIVINHIDCDDSENSDLISKYRILSLPTLVKVDENGKELKRETGNIPREKLINFIKD